MLILCQRFGRSSCFLDTVDARLFQKQVDGQRNAGFVQAPEELVAYCPFKGEVGPL